MIVFTDDSHRDLKGKEAAASMARPAGAGKKKEPAASEPRVPLARLFPLESTAEARPAGAGKKRKEATAEKKVTEATAEKKEMEATAEKKGVEATAEKKGKVADSLFEEGEMLRLREEFWEIWRLWEDGLVEGVLDRWLERKQQQTTQAPVVDKKKVVREILPESYIHFITENPSLMRELSDEEMAKCPEKYRQMYVIQKMFNAKKLEYQNALIDQYKAFGFAYEEKEVTDDDHEKEVTDDDEKEVAVVNN